MVKDVPLPGLVRGCQGVDGHAAVVSCLFTHTLSLAKLDRNTSFQDGNINRKEKAR
jgi:hypothetical protein